jgi:hypothetical protein
MFLGLVAELKVGVEGASAVALYSRVCVRKWVQVRCCTGRWFVVVIIGRIVGAACGSGGRCREMHR